MKKKYGRWLLVLLFILVLAMIYNSPLLSYFEFSYIKEQKTGFKNIYLKHPWTSMGFYFLFYVLVTTLSIPGAAILTLLGGALFGVVKGTVIVSFASAIGATFSFLAARYLLKDWIQNKYSNHLKAINQGIKKEGAFYLFSLRLIPAFPFFLINLLMGLTPITIGTYFIISQLGMLPGTLVFVNAGTQLSQLESYQEILSPSIVASLVALGMLPLIIKKILPKLKKYFKEST